MQMRKQRQQKVGKFYIVVAILGDEGAPVARSRHHTQDGFSWAGQSPSERIALAGRSSCPRGEGISGAPFPQSAGDGTGKCDPLTASVGTFLAARQARQ